MRFSNTTFKGSRLERLELECPLAIVDRVVARHAQIVVAQQGQRRRIIAGNPEFPSGPIFPEVNLDRLIERGLNDLVLVAQFFLDAQACSP